MRSKSSAEGETGSGFEGGGDWAPPKRSLTGWEGPEFDKADGLAEKAFQSPNSPFPLDDVAAEEEIFNLSLSNVSFTLVYITVINTSSLPVDVGRLAEAAGEEKSAKPLMRSEFAPAYTQQNHKLSIGTYFFNPTFASDCIYLP